MSLRSVCLQKIMREKHRCWDFPGGPVVKTPVLPLQGPWVRSLIRELRCHILCGRAENKTKQKPKQTKKKSIDVCKFNRTKKKKNA